MRRILLMLSMLVSTAGMCADRLYMVVDLLDGTFSYRESSPAGGWSDEYKTTKIVFRRIEPGSFTMGDMVHGGKTYPNVRLTRPYYIGVFEVTQRQWEIVMGTRPSHFSENYATRPVECISYSMVRGGNLGLQWPQCKDVDADSFVGQLRAIADLDFDLPTEAQWEYACRSGTTTDFGDGTNYSREYDDPNLNRLAMYGEELNYSWDVGTLPVGSKAPNLWGLYDMHGNVEEHCLDRWGELQSNVDDPEGPETGTRFAARGGHWWGKASSCCSHIRSSRDPFYENTDGQGLRLVVRMDYDGPFVENYDGVSWKYMLDASGATVASGEGAAISRDTAGSVVVPSTLGGNLVREIGEDAFSMCGELVSVTIPASVTKISGGAFYRCSKLEKIVFEGDEPIEILDDPFYRTGTNCKIYATHGTKWSVAIPGIWQGLPIVYLPWCDDTLFAVPSRANGSTFSFSTSLALTTQNGCEIFYTRDGSVPTKDSSVYRGALSISETTTVKYMVVDMATGNWSPIGSVTLTRVPAESAAITVTPSVADGTRFVETQYVTLLANGGETIWYTTDGSDPKTSSTRKRYTGSIYMSQSTELKYYGVNSYGDYGKVASVYYIMRLADGGPYQSVIGGITWTLRLRAVRRLSWAVIRRKVTLPFRRSLAVASWMGWRMDFSRDIPISVASQYPME